MNSNKLMNVYAKYQQPKSNNKKVVDLRVSNKNKKNNKISIENKSKVCSEAYI